mmetsp:Transcript_27476/g.76791  ORF Transcript_27476/g.76791 Transcript_27476/m.76791 type:complete len:84 (+) Transcript_27476:339-590(+)
MAILSFIAIRSLHRKFAFRICSIRYFFLFVGESLFKEAVDFTNQASIVRSNCVETIIGFIYSPKAALFKRIEWLLSSGERHES